MFSDFMYGDAAMCLKCTQKMKNTIFTHNFTMSMISGAGLFFTKIAVNVFSIMFGCTHFLQDTSKNCLQSLPFVKTKSTAGGAETHQ